MVRKRSDSSSLEDENPGGLTMTDVLMLPNQLRQIVQWMMRQKEVNSAEVAAQFGLEEVIAQNLLDDLVQQDFVQQRDIGGRVSYRTKLVRTHAIQQLSQSIQQALAPGSPLGLILNPSGNYAVVAGSTFELCVTVSNQGNQSALIDIYIDETSQLFEWCIAPKERLALGSNSSSEVIFQFQVPSAATPGTYSYLLVVDAPQHYPEDTPIRHQARLQVLPPAETTVRVSDPTFTLIPSTSSVSPALVQPGTVQVMRVLVHNRSDRVDRFRLSCTDLPTPWFSVVYPEGIEFLGVVSATDGLNLNPGDRGEIQLLLNIPSDAEAGRYFPTVRLYSVNNPDLVLLDVVYLQIRPVYVLNVELRSLVSKVRRKEGVYELRLTNVGNTERNILITAFSADEEDVCSYSVVPTQLRILPKTGAISAVRVQPVKWWRRPLFGAGRIINFRVELEDVEQLPLPNDMPQGTLIWEARPWWQLVLFLLLTLGTVAALIFLIWWLFIRPPSPPKIAQFASEDTFYSEADGDFIRLNWEIRNPRQIETLNIAGQSQEGTADVQPLIYNFRRGIPDELKNNCALQVVLICKNVRTDARRAGDYVFELKVFSKRQKDIPSDTVKSNPIKIEPIALPKILEFSSTKPVYQEAAQFSLATNGGQRTTDIRDNTIALNWNVINLDQLKELRLIGRNAEGTIISPLKRYDFSNGVPEALKEFCSIEATLVCKNVLTNAKSAGDYVFELTTVTQKGVGEPAESKKTDAIKIQPQPPRIVEFKINGKEAFPKYLIEISRDRKPTILTISWRVLGGKDLKVELMPAPGTVPAIGAMPYILSQQANTETLTLQVTNSAGQQVSRSVTLETVAPPPPPQRPTPPPRSAGPTVVPLPPGIVPAAPVPAPAEPLTQGQPPSPPSPSSLSPSPTGESADASPSSTAPTPSASPSPGSPMPSEPGSVSPLELPPRAD